MIVLTGASSGIGAAAAVVLARLGHTVFASGRHAGRLARVVRRMRRVAPRPSAIPEPVVADLSEKAGVATLAAAVRDIDAPITALALNAGIEAHSYRVNSAGVEMTLAVNHLAPVYLTYLLWDQLHADGARIVVTTSSNHADGKLDPDLSMASDWSTSSAYDASKLANVLFVQWLRQRTSLPVSAFHPGSITTALNRESPTYHWERLRELFVYDRPAKGAETLVHLATAPETASDVAPYWQDCRPAPVSGQAEDLAVADWAMARTEEALDIRFPQPVARRAAP